MNFYAGPAVEGAPTVRRVVIAITGASGVVFGIRMLEVLGKIPDVETHLLISRGGRATIALEDARSLDEVRALADVVHADHDLTAPIASGSFLTSGMVVAPCSIKSLSAIANCFDDTLIARAADVHLKERRPVVLMVRETPLHAGHLRLMQQATESGATVFPPVPAFYHQPTTIADIVDQTVGRALDQLHIDSGVVSRWRESSAEGG